MGDTAVYTFQEKRSRKKPTQPTPWLWTSTLQNCKKVNSSCLSYQVWGALLGQPKERNISFEAFSASQFSSVQFTCSVVSNSSRPHEPQHARPPCPSPTPGVYSNSCPLSRWCHPTISSSVVTFSSRLQSFPASGSFPMSQLFASGGQSMEFQLQHQSFQWTPRTDFL